jgi:hypothetical protein
VVYSAGTTSSMVFASSILTFLVIVAYSAGTISSTTFADSVITFLV